MDFGYKIFWLDTVDSTQEEVKRQMQGLDNLTVIAARFQTAGKGQRGNKWSSGRGQNLMFSILLAPGSEGIAEISAVGQFHISIVSALAVKELLESEGVPCKIKWPNDIYVGDRKICGMLIENTLRGSMVDKSIIGIGLNVNQTDFPPELMNPTSVARILHRETALEPLLEKLMDIFCRLLGEEPSVLRQKYLESLYRLGQKYSYTDVASGEVFTGEICGINEEAKLLVRLQDGRLKSFAFKEISYVI